MKMLSILNADDVKKARRAFEEELRREVKNLLNEGMYDEAEDLFFRLTKTLRKKALDYERGVKAVEEMELKK